MSKEVRFQNIFDLFQCVSIKNKSDFSRIAMLARWSWPWKIAKLFDRQKPDYLPTGDPGASGVNVVVIVFGDFRQKLSIFLTTDAALDSFCINGCNLSRICQFFSEEIFLKP
jgi:hypothetical protein